jgi:hypothetical protein
MNADSRVPARRPQGEVPVRAGAARRNARDISRGRWGRSGGAGILGIGGSGGGACCDCCGACCWGWPGRGGSLGGITPWVRVPCWSARVCDARAVAGARGARWPARSRSLRGRWPVRSRIAKIPRAGVLAAGAARRGAPGSAWPARVAGPGAAAAGPASAARGQRLSTALASPVAPPVPVRLQRARLSARQLRTARANARQSKNAPLMSPCREWSSVRTRVSHPQPWRPSIVD